ATGHDRDICLASYLLHPIGSAHPVPSTRRYCMDARTLVHRFPRCIHLLTGHNVALKPAYGSGVHSHKGCVELSTEPVACALSRLIVRKMERGKGLHERYVRIRG